MITGPVNWMLNIPLKSHWMNFINLVGYCLLMPENCACERSKRMSEVFPFPKLNSFLPEFGINRSLFLSNSMPSPSLSILNGNMQKIREENDQAIESIRYIMHCWQQEDNITGLMHSRMTHTLLQRTLYSKGTLCFSRA